MVGTHVLLDLLLLLLLLVASRKGSAKEEAINWVDVARGLTSAAVVATCAAIAADSALVVSVDTTATDPEATARAQRDDTAAKSQVVLAFVSLLLLVPCC